MKVKFSRCNSNSLANVPQVDGQLIYVKDTQEVYMDVGNTRNNITNFLKKDNTIAFTPTQDYHPSTKKYVDDSLIDYVKNTDYASTNKGGVVKIGSGSGVDQLNGVLRANEYSYEAYPNVGRNAFIGKGTLENVIEGKGLISDIDYATQDKGGTLKTGNGFNVNSFGTPYGSSWNYATYINMATSAFISKGTLENVITGKGLLSNTDYATSSSGGVIKVSTSVASLVDSGGILYAQTKTYDDYSNGANSMFIGKGTLENVITGKQLVNQTDLSNALATFAPTSTSTTFDNTETGLQATNVQDAIEELLSKISTLETTVGQVDAILDEIIGENTDITDVVYTTTDFTLNPETGYYEVSGAGNWEISISFTKHSVGTVSLNYKGTKLSGMESYSHIYLDNVEDSISSSIEYTNFDFENVTAGTHTIRIVVNSGDDRTNMSVKLLTQTN